MTPALVVFDLDLTLWTCGNSIWCDCLTPPFFQDSQGRLSDREGSHIRLYQDVPQILDALHQAGCKIGIASRTSAPSWACQLLELLGVAHRFDYQAIYPGDKQRHFRQLQEESSVPLDAMVFFDDERRNIVSVGQLGVRCIEVSSGMHWEVFANTMKRYPMRDTIA